MKATEKAEYMELRRYAKIPAAKALRMAKDEGRAERMAACREDIARIKLCCDAGERFYALVDGTLCLYGISKLGAPWRVRRIRDAKTQADVERITGGRYFAGTPTAASLVALGAPQRHNLLISDDE